MREAEEEIFETSPPPLSWLNGSLFSLFTHSPGTLDNIDLSGGGGGGGEVVGVEGDCSSYQTIPFICILIKYSAYSCSELRVLVS